MTAKEYLNQYRDMIGRIERLKDRIKKAENIIDAIKMDGMPKGSGIGDPTKNKAIKLALLKDQYIREMVEAEEVCQRITRDIERVPDEKARTLLYSRYIEFKSWEQVADDLKKYRNGREYEVKSVTGYAHKRALDLFEKVIKEANDER